MKNLRNEVMENSRYCKTPESYNYDSAGQSSCVASVVLRSPERACNKTERLSEHSEKSV